MASKPTVAPDFATDTNYPAGANPWSAQPNKVSPAGIIATGFIPATYLASDHVNYMLNNHGQWINYIKGASRQNFIQATWMGTYSVAANIYYCNDFHTDVGVTGTWTGATGGATYDSPSMTAAVPAQRDSAFVKTVNRIQIPTFFNGSFSVDISMSATGANNLTIVAGLSDALSVAADATFGAVTAASSCCVFQKKSTDTNWQCITGDGAALTTTSSATAGSTSFVNLRIDIYGATYDTGGKRAEFYINDTLVATNTANIGTTANEYVWIQVSSTAATANTASVGTTSLVWSRKSGA